MRKNRLLTLGFTMVELVVAIMVIGILIAISLPLYLEHAERAMGAKALENLQNIFNAEMMYMVDNESFTNLRANLESYCAIGPNDTDWTYNIVATQDTFTATAIRTSPNATYNGLQISMDQDSNINFPGSAESYPP